jgi:tRNA nucleotidyltransferase (CCA-adding enzyme)
MKVGHENHKNYIIEYYKSLLGTPTPNYFSLAESQIDDIPQLSEEESSIIVANYAEEEVHDDIMQMQTKRH